MSFTRRNLKDVINALLVLAIDLREIKLASQKFLSAVMSYSEPFLYVFWSRKLKWWYRFIVIERLKGLHL